jgi:hypothetical protein
MLISTKMLVYVSALSLALILVMDTGGLTSGLRAIYYFLEDGAIDDDIDGNQLHNRSNKVRECTRTSHTHPKCAALTHHQTTHTSPHPHPASASVL